ncbi:MAG: preprotein translocase subunit SecA [Planctomycetia bacterium]|nr:preprotein translocase subunit SecA [Planctomycetia bacterium]
MNLLRGLVAVVVRPGAIRLAHYRRLVPRIGAMEGALAAESDAQLTERALALRYRAQCREPLEKLVVETYALVREAARRTIGLRHYDVQILGGLALFNGGIAEMQTGEGKTLVATLPLALRALGRKGALLATANDYLAARDAEWMGPVYRQLGLTVGVVTAGVPRDKRREAYACDITYGTAREFGFDFLRDRLAQRESGESPLAWLGGWTPAESDAGGGDAEQSLVGSRHSTANTVQRPPHFILVDEADSLLIDEARTPLILSGGAPETAPVTAAGCRWGALIADQFVEREHFEFNEERLRLALTAAGRDKLRSIPAPRELDGLKMFALYEFVERAILVTHKFHRDRQYVVRDGEVVIVDEFTGRISEGRRWQAGIHQAIEAREGVKITHETQAMARITVQDFFLRFPHLAGMTGTALPAARELKQLYRLRVVPIPTHRPSRRERLPDRVFESADDKWGAVVAEAAALQARGRPLLIGTRSIELSEHLSRLLTRAGVEHAVLNARDPAGEAEIVAHAGTIGKVTVATNMAGRGTDIELGDGVAELGGLCVIGTEMHDSARIDRQLAGRCGRQGDPGSFQQFLSLEDDLLRTAFGEESAVALAAREAAALRSDPKGAAPRIARHFAKAQRLVERRQRRDRVQLQHYEARRHRMHREMGQDPYLDSPE